MAYTQLGHHIADRIVQWHLKEVAFEQWVRTAPANSCESICWEENRQDIHWEEEGKEFSLYGKMYDVARIEKQKDRTIIYCIADSKEDELLHQLAMRTHNRPDGKTVRVACFFFLYNDVPDFGLAASVKEAGVIAFPLFDDATVSQARGALAPPPKA